MTKAVKSNRPYKSVNSKIRSTGLDTSRFIYHETPTPAVDGSTVLFSTAYGYVDGFLEVFLDGLLQVKDTDYTETSPSAGTFTMTNAPDSDEKMKVNYIKRS